MMCKNSKLSHLKLDQANINNKAKQWNFSAGRLKEKIGISGTCFNQNFDGVRAVYTKDKTQFRMGYGNFAHSTGIVDSPYTRVDAATPTMLQFFGIDRSNALNPIITEPNTNNTIGFYKQIVDANGDEPKSSNIW